MAISAKTTLHTNSFI